MRHGESQPGILCSRIRVGVAVCKGFEPFTHELYGCSVVPSHMEQFMRFRKDYGLHGFGVGGMLPVTEGTEQMAQCVAKLDGN